MALTFRTWSVPSDVIEDATKVQHRLANKHGVKPDEISMAGDVMRYLLARDAALQAIEQLHTKPITETCTQ